jgi:endoglucanase
LRHVQSLARADGSIARNLKRRELGFGGRAAYEGRMTQTILFGFLATAVALSACSSCGESATTATNNPVDAGAERDTPSTPVVQDDAGDAGVKTVVGVHGRLQVNGVEIHDEHGAPVELRGMSLFWSQWGAAIWNTQVIDTLVDDWHSTIVRASMAVELGGYLTDPAAEKAKVKRIVDHAVQRGIYVIIDWHDHNANLHTDPSKAFFKEMAEAYGQTPNVIFELFNEPEQQTWAQVKTYANAVIPVIRAAGAKNLIVIGSPHWDQDVDVAANDPLSDTNLAYSLHFYSATHKQPLRDKATTAINKGLPLFVTEWGSSEASGGGPLDLAEAQTWLDFMHQHKLSWCNWSLFDKDESSCALVPGSSMTGGWPDSALTASGRFAKAKIGEGR